MIRVAIFDLDNTLVDRQAAFERFAVQFAERHGLQTEGARWLIEADRDGLAERPYLFERARSHFGLADPLDELVAAYYPEYLSHFAPDEAVQVALERLKGAEWRVAVATNGPSTQRLKINAAGLTPWLDAICISGELGFAKPDRRIFAAAVAAVGGGKEALGRAWMVGDMPAADIQGAHRAGMRAAWLHRGRRWEEPDYAPDAIVASVPDAVELLLADG
ncbi:MAG TPA: HAD-IA family hydrolase [Acidimicrobiales bacterium]|nr:HAD-IA family hydrolase [Acidimicrobiales bacterium]